MAFRALVSVGNYDFAEPSAYSGNTSTLVDSARNAQWARVQKCFRQSSGGKFINLVSFFDQSVGGWVTKEMYVSDRKSGMWRRDPENGDILGWTDCALSLVEV